MVDEVRAVAPAEPPVPFSKPDLSNLPPAEPFGLSTLAAKRFRVSCFGGAVGVDLDLVLVC